MIEYIQFTERRPMTRPFRPSDDEHKLYEAVSAFLLRETRMLFQHVNARLQR